MKKLQYFWRFLYEKFAKARAKFPNLITLFISAARKFEQKRAKFLKNPKDLHQSNFKISKDLHQRPPKSHKYLHQSPKNYAKNRFKQVF